MLSLLFQKADKKGKGKEVPVGRYIKVCGLASCCHGQLCQCGRSSTYSWARAPVRLQDIDLLPSLSAMPNLQ